MSVEHRKQKYRRCLESGISRVSFTREHIQLQYSIHGLSRTSKLLFVHQILLLMHVIGSNQQLADTCHSESMIKMFFFSSGC